MCCKASVKSLQYNKTLGKFHLEGIPPAPRGVPQIEVTFDIDVNGVVHVSAKDKGTGKDKKITITASSGLAKDEVERMVREAESHAADDARRREEVEVRNSADNMVYSARKTLEEHKERISSDLTSEIERSIGDVEAALKTDDIGRIKTSSEALKKALQGVGSAIYGQSGSGGDGGTGGAGYDSAGSGSYEGASGGDSSGPRDENTVEGEYKEV